MCVVCLKRGLDFHSKKESLFNVRQKLFKKYLQVAIKKKKKLKRSNRKKIEIILGSDYL